MVTTGCPSSGILETDIAGALALSYTRHLRSRSKRAKFVKRRDEMHAAASACDARA
jgi:hypothetical protein